ncbi:MAG TPA: hypothetical protein VH880_13985 [Anaeromyxobacteraceae bacterium]
MEGGARNIWVTPFDQVTDAHRNAILRSWLALAGKEPPPAPTRRGGTTSR